MPTTPEPPSGRARTPPTPLHGPDYDNYQPYSPRRSTRSTAQSNPYSSLHGERSPKLNNHRNITPPATLRKTRFTRVPTHLSSPPSSPASPAQHRTPQQLHKTPRKVLFSSRKAASGAHSDSDHAPSSLPRSSIDPATMLPTPSKTPKKRNAKALNSTARILSFQPNDPNDVMPSASKIKKHGRFDLTNGFDLYDEEREAGGDKIEIFTDANARVPEMDEAEDNPFIGTHKTAAKPKRKGRMAQAAHDAVMEDAVRREEGVVYVFRGRKIFRRFSEAEHEGASSAGTDNSDVPGQRTLKRQAGAAARRPLTRSAIKPRLLFPSEQQLHEREQVTDDVDEEAETDIDVPDTTSPAKQKGKAQDARTQSAHRFNMASSPSTSRVTRSAAHKASPGRMTPIDEDEAEPMPVGFDTNETFPSQPKRKNQSPFDSWQRTKTGSKRAGDSNMESAGSVKRLRRTAVGSPA